jgi:hypothetical protein
MKDKIKEKIEKLLNLSMSENEHEAKLALEKALKLMSEHSITKEDVYKQNFISENLIIDNVRLPDWKVDLYSYMAHVSGCIFTWRNGWHKSQKAIGTITGRERDVQNAVYLCEFLSREVDKKTKLKKKELKESGYKSTCLSSYLKSFKKGLIKIVYVKLYEQQNNFFTQQTQEAGLVCMELKTKVQEAENFFGKKTEQHKSKAQRNTRAEADGVMNGRDISINQAVSRQDDIKQIGA